MPLQFRVLIIAEYAKICEPVQKLYDYAKSCGKCLSIQKVDDAKIEKVTIPQLLQRNDVSVNRLFENFGNLGVYVLFNDKFSVVVDNCIAWSAIFCHSRRN